MPQRPTTLRLITEHCPRALDHRDAGVPYDRRHFAVGVAAHDVLHAYGLHGMDGIEPCVRALLERGRDGVDSEPPLPPDVVFRGRDLALFHISRCHGELGGPNAKFEVGIGWGPGWVRETYSDATWLRSRLDVVDECVLDDDEFPLPGLMATDYKSSWSAGPGWLESVQAKVQALGLVDQWDRFTDEAPAFVRRRVVNLETGQSWHADLFLDDDADIIAGWRKDIEALTAAAEAKPRVASPGVSCMGCPYVLHCEDASAAMRNPSVVAIAFAVTRAHLDALTELAMSAAEHQTIPTPGGTVGWDVKDSAIASEDAPAALVDAWRSWPDAGIRSSVVGLVRAMKPGAGSVRAVAKVLFPGRKQKRERNEWVEKLLTTKPRRIFGIIKEVS